MIGDLSRLFLVTVVALLTAVAFPAATVYFANSSDFDIGYQAMAPGLLAVIAGASAIVALMCLALPAQQRARATALILAIAIGAWAQANLFVWDYGILDGSGIDWSAYRGRSLLEIAVWISLLGFALRYAATIHGNALTIAVALTAIQLVPMAVSAANVDTPSHHAYRLSAEHKFTLSNNRNVIVVVLDAFQADVFQEIIDNNPRYRSAFEGFTFFRNAVAGYAKTYASVPLMLTGEWYRNDQPINEFMRNAYMGSSLPRKLKGAGWDVRLYPAIERILHFDESIATNIERTVSRRDQMLGTGTLVDVGVFRAVPHVLKRTWINDFNWRVRPALERALGPEDTDQRNLHVASRNRHHALRFLENSEVFTHRGKDSNVFRLYHLNVPHAPFVLNEDLQLERLPRGRAGYYRHSVAGIEVVLRYLDHLRATGAYEDAVIAIVSDHGGGEYGATIRNMAIQQVAESAPASDVEPAHHQSGLPLILVKPATSREPLKISDAPVSLGDLAITLAGLAGISGRFAGADMFSLAADMERPRNFYFYRFDGWTNRHLPPLVEYLVTGHSWLESSWTRTGRVLAGVAEDKAAPTSVIALRVGDELKMTEETAPHQLLVDGWAEPEPGGTWTSRQNPILNVPLVEPLTRSAVLEIDVHPYLAGGRIPEQVVHFNINGIPVKSAFIPSIRRIHIPLPKAQFQGASELTVELTIPTAAAPIDFQLAPDDRTLGIFVTRLALRPKAVVELGRPISFANGGTSANYLLSGWALQEEGHRWTVGPEARLRIPLADDSPDSLSMRVYGSAKLPPGLDHQTVRLSAGGVDLATWQVGPIPAWYAVTVPLEGPNHKDLEIVLKVEHPTMPCQSSGSTDCRELGMAVREMVIDRAEAITIAPI
jgi:hypothetical protein